jgi:uncharacterized membrane protein
MLGNLLPGYQHLQNIHPMVVHFPIAFLMGAALLYFAAWLLHNQTLATVGFYLLILGTLGAAAAAGTGLYAEDGVMIDPSVKDNLLQWHEYLMLSVAGLSIALTGWAIWARPFPQKGRLVFLTLFLALVLTLAWGADFGGRMVYDYNAGGSACPQFIEFTK